MLRKVCVLGLLMLLVGGCAGTQMNTSSEPSSQSVALPMCEQKLSYMVHPDELRQPISACNISFALEIDKDTQSGGGWERRIQFSSHYHPFTATETDQGETPQPISPTRYKWRIVNPLLLQEESWDVHFAYEEVDGVYTSVLGLTEQDWQYSILEVHFATLDSSGVLQNVVYEFAISNFVVLATPQHTLDAYFTAIDGEDTPQALSLWEAPVADVFDSEERESRAKFVTERLISEQVKEYDIFDVEWWSTCCEPSVICQPSRVGPGVVRVKTTIYPVVGDAYRLDFDLSQSYPITPTGELLEGWIIRDAYTTSEDPLFWRWRANLYGEYLP